MCKMQLTVKTMIIPEIYNYKKNSPMVISQKAWAYLNLFSRVLLPMIATGCPTILFPLCFLSFFQVLEHAQRNF